jgi:hypothetical protein
VTFIVPSAGSNTGKDDDNCGKEVEFHGIKFLYNDVS